MYQAPMNVELVLVDKVQSARLAMKFIRMFFVQMSQQVGREPKALSAKVASMRNLWLNIGQALVPVQSAQSGQNCVARHAGDEVVVGVSNVLVVLEDVGEILMTCQVSLEIS